ncbi:glycerol kinase GlpK [Rickettsiales bacterium LUAb2]
MNDKYILALDQGTTSSRAILFDKQANIKGIAQKEFKQIYPEAGLVEHDANEIWATQLSVLTEVIAQASVYNNEIAAIGITNQRETTVVWDKHTGKPIHNAIVWQDRRTAKYCDSLKKQGKEQFILNKTGLVIDSYFSGTKVKWILDNVSGAREKADKGDLLFGTIDSWLIWKLTKGQVHATDYSNASRTLLFNINTMQWDQELLELFDIPAKMLPQVKQSSEIYGYAHEDVVGNRIPISGVAGDQQAATFGQACLKEGMAKNTYGTGCFTLINIGKEPIISKDKLLTTVAWGRKNTVTYALEGSVFIGGAVVQWLRDELGLIEKSSDIEALSKQVSDNGGVYLVPAFVGLGAPNWDSYARGSIHGLTRGVNKSHIARAALESIAFQSYDVLSTMEKSNAKLSELRVDGGASKNDSLMQFQADILGCVVVRPKITETTALGSAYLAGLAIGYWESADEIVSLWQVDRKFVPSMNEDQKQSLLHNWQKAVERSKNWLE